MAALPAQHPCVRMDGMIVRWSWSDSMADGHR